VAGGFRFDAGGEVNSNFSFLAKRFSALEKLGTLAESYLYSDPNSCLFKMGAFVQYRLD